MEIKQLATAAEIEEVRYLLREYETCLVLTKLPGRYAPSGGVTLPDVVYWEPDL
jgi:hypothetical protein